MRNIGKQLNKLLANIKSSGISEGANIMFVSMFESDNASDIACKFAELAASHAQKPVLLFDLDFIGNCQYEKLIGHSDNNQIPLDIDNNSKNRFIRLYDSDNSEILNSESLLLAYQVKYSKLYVSRLLNEKVPDKSYLQIGSNHDYWQSLKNQFELNVIYAPPLKLLEAGLAVVSDMDAVILVINEWISRDYAFKLRDAVLKNGGKILGVVLIEENIFRKPHKLAA